MELSTVSVKQRRMRNENQRRKIHNTGYPSGLIDSGLCLYLYGGGIIAMTDEQIEIEDDLNAIRCAMSNIKHNSGHMTKEQRLRLSEMFVEIIRFTVKGTNK